MLRIAICGGFARATRMVCAIFTRATLCSRILAMALCLSVTSRCSVETDEQIDLVFGVGASFQPSYTVLKGNSWVSPEIRILLWNFVSNKTPFPTFQSAAKTIFV